ncbi:MAG: Phosphatidylserine decarboxylase proenzyme [Burkholderia sp.]
MSSRIYPHPIIAKEGWPMLIGTLAIALILWLLDFGFLAFLVFLLFLFMLQFFRDPAREAPDDPRAVLSAVDGRVCKVVRAKDPLTGEEATMISVFMNLFSVHSQKAPVAGTVEQIVYTPGTFVNADLDKASTDNERNAVRVRMEDGRSVTFVQIAGLVARRILCYTSIGDKLERGERYGFIRFGSRVDIYLPTDAEVVVTIGDKVLGGVTVLARL